MIEPLRSCCAAGVVLLAVVLFDAGSVAQPPPADAQGKHASDRAPSLPAIPTPAPRADETPTDIVPSGPAKPAPPSREKPADTAPSDPAKPPTTPTEAGEKSADQAPSAPAKPATPPADVQGEKAPDPAPADLTKPTSPLTQAGEKTVEEPEADQKASDAQPKEGDAKLSPAATLRAIPMEEVTSLLGKKVRSAGDEDMGMVVDVLIDGEGRPRAAVIDFGGFLGVGSRKVAVHWEALEFQVRERAAPLILKLDRADVQAAPEFKPTNQPAEVVTPAGPGEKSAEPSAIASPEPQVPDAGSGEAPATSQQPGMPTSSGPAPAGKAPDAGSEEPPATAQPAGPPAPSSSVTGEKAPNAGSGEPAGAAQPGAPPASSGPAPAAKAPHACCQQPPAGAQPQGQPIAPNGPPAPDAGR
jgi:hypothetical protein